MENPLFADQEEGDDTYAGGAEGYEYDSGTLEKKEDLVSMHVCMSLCMMCVCVCVCTCAPAHTHTHTHTHTRSTYLCVCAPMWMQVCEYLF